jgi:F-type H+-transporting ATPase subunit epsilon
MPLTLEIVTPDKKVFCETVDHVAMPTASGEIDVLPGHIPLLTIVTPGELRISRSGSPSALAVDKGFAQVLGDKVSIICEGAIDVAKIDLAAVEAARMEAEKSLALARERGEDPSLIEELETKARFAIVQQLVKKR